MTSAANSSELIARFCAPAGDARPAPRTLFVVAHPDDEAVGAGARLPRLGDAAVFAHVTDGAPRDLYDATRYGFASREAYAEARRGELAAGLALAGIPDPQRQTRELGVVDQEATANLVALARQIADLIAELRPEIVLTHPYEGGHPDHDATAFAVHAALRLLEKEGATPPLFIEATSYHNGPGGIVVSEFLPSNVGDGHENATPPVTTLTLSERERDFKRRLLACFPTQQETLGLFPASVERFRPAPRYDFARPPHLGALFYENFGWGGVTGEAFCARAREAMNALGLEGAL